VSAPTAARAAARAARFASALASSFVRSIGVTPRRPHHHRAPCGPGCKLSLAQPGAPG
jgi:hypothetical protein